MNAHASTLQLDELAAGLAAPQVRAHVDGCDACRTALARVAQDRAQTMAAPRFGQVRASLPSRRPVRWLLWLSPAAACAALLLFFHPAGGLRAKGGASLTLTPAAPHAGDEAELHLASGGKRYALVVADGVVLWPAGGTASGELPAGGHASVRVHVTPGAVRVVAAYSDRPLTRAEPGDGVVLRALEIRP